MDEIYQNTGNEGSPSFVTSVDINTIQTFEGFDEFLEIAFSLNPAYARYKEADAKLCSFMYEGHVDRNVMHRIAAFCGFEVPTYNMISGPAGTWCVGLKLISAHLQKEFIRVSHQESYLVAMPYSPQLRSTVFFATYIWFQLRPMHISANNEIQAKKVGRLLKHYPE